ncbi:CCT domain-containing protein [Dioscorea alata]|uniref:CCT domain-containing protein n=1 Tax=Dioscorea alata TaxID=55571 RepID=A0ACB7W3I3_DIOAL|nr:CCT domain-containing protein [Dioscorea alata]
MYALPFSPGFFQDSPAVPHHHHIPLPGDELLHRFTAPLWGNFAETIISPEYDLLGEDLFKSPKHATQELAFALDPMTAAISMLSCNEEDLLTVETDKNVDIKPLENELLNVVFCDSKELVEIDSSKNSVSVLSDVNLVSIQMEKNQVVQAEKLVREELLPESVSSKCRRSAGLIDSCNVRPNFLHFQGLDLGDEYGIRRAYSEGDIQTLGRKKSCPGTTSIVHSSVNISHLKTDNKIEDRQQKLCRYMKKKSKRNFSRKIKYACRKALADSQPRVRGRFAKTDKSV